MTYVRAHGVVRRVLHGLAVAILFALGSAGAVQAAIPGS